MSTKFRVQIVCSFLVSFSMAAVAQSAQVMAYVDFKHEKENVSSHFGDGYHHYTSLEKNALPSFRGGESALLAYIDENMNYPDLALEYGIEGKTFVEFTIDQNGKATNPLVNGKLGFGCDQEVKRIVNSMPQWNPEIENGKAVSSTVHLAVSFRLNP